MSLILRRISRSNTSLSRQLLLAASAVVFMPVLAFGQNGTMTGTVTNAATAAAVQGAQVFVCMDTGGGGSNCSGTTTNASGAFSISRPAGTYYALTSNSGLINEVYNNVQCPVSACSTQFALASGAPIVVTAGNTTPGINFALDPGDSISGTVFDAATSAPVQSVTVNIYARVGTSTTFVASNNTNASGGYTVSGLPAGTYYAFTSNSVGYTNEIYNNVLCPGSCSSTIAVNSGTPIPVTTGVPVTGKNFALDLGGKISGTITNAETSAPAQSVFVNVRTRIAHDTFLTFVASAITNASGVYTVQGLPTGTYYLATSGSSGLVHEIYNDVQCVGGCSPTVPAPGAPVQVSLGNTTSGIDFQLDPGGAIAGTITDSITALPLQNVFVGVYQSSGSGVQQVAQGFTTVAGVYNVAGIPTGNYYVVAFPSATYVPEVYDNIPCTGACNTATVLTGAPIPVTDGATTGGRNFSLDPAGTITGTVTNAATAAPLPSISVDVYVRVGSSSLYVGSGFTNSVGAWSLGGLAAGTYYASTSSSSSFRLNNEIYDNIQCGDFCSAVATTSSGTPITVNAAATTSGINFGLSPSTRPPSAPTSFGAVVSGFRVSFSWSAPTSGAPATSYIIEAGVAPGTTAVTFTTGSTSLEIPGAPPGRFYVRVKAVNAYGTSQASTEFVLVINADGSGGLLAPTNLVVRINGGRLTATWAAATFGGVPTSYLLEVGTGTGLSNIASLPLTERNFTYLGVPNGVYFFRVRSRHSQIGPPSAEIMLVVGNVPAPPEPPRNLTHTLTASSLTLTWQAPFFGAPTSYVIEAGTEPGLTNIAVLNTGSTATTATFSGVPPGTYYVRTRAVNALGRSVVSNERTIVVQ